MNTDQFLEWPFFEARHRQLKQQLNAWAAAHHTLLDAHGDDVAEATRKLAAALGQAGWLAPKALISAEFGREEAEAPEGFELLDQRRHGLATLMFLRAP